MNTERICPSCRRPLPEGAPQGLCPECLMKAGLGSASGAPGGTPHFTPPSVEELAKSFPQLEILDLIGQGGMGAVYRARQPSLDRLVALKILPPEVTNTPGFAERFAREARSLARLSHSNIVGVYDFGQAGGLHYFIMEYVDGLNLRQLVQSGRLSPPEALRIIPQICDALQFAHDEGIVHRDIKPENVMLDKRGRVKIADFGLAKLLGREPEIPQLTGAKDIMGTPLYMAPEQMERPNAVDHRADIYSLGVVFYEMLTGELPMGKFAPPSKKVEVDVRLDEVVLHALEKEPALRYQHASQMKTDVESIAHAPSATPPPHAETRPSEALQFEQAHRQVQGPALGLIVTSVLNWLGIPLTLLIVGRIAILYSLGKAPFLLLGLSAFLLTGVMLVAGLKMKRLQAYWLAVTGSILAMLITPANIVGLPIGIWSLVILTQKRVRDSFGKDYAVFTPPAPARGGAWKIAAVIAAAMMLLLAIPAGVLILFVTFPAIQRARLVAQAEHAAQAQEAQRMNQFRHVKTVDLTISEAEGQYQALDLDSGQVKNIPADLLAQKNKTEIFKWLAKEGLDLMVGRGAQQSEIITAAENETELTPVSNADWGSETLENTPAATTTNVLAEVVRKEGSVEYRLSADAKPPLTFRFQTANGSRGLLHVTAFGEHPHHVKLQFVTVRKTD